MSTTKDKKKTEKQPKKGLIAFGVGAVALVAGAAAFFWASPASAKGSAKKGKADKGGGSGPGGSKPKRPEGGSDGSGARDGQRRANDPRGYWWGDSSKIPADFDYQSNRIWISPERDAVAVGFYYFLDGEDEAGNRVTYDAEGLSFVIADATFLAPTKDVDHREDAPPKLKPILDSKSEFGDSVQSVFAWVAAYYGTAISPTEAATSRAMDLVQAMVDEASVLNGNARGPIDTSGPLREFYAYAAQRLDMGRKALYGDGFLWGQGEDALS